MLISREILEKSENFTKFLPFLKRQKSDPKITFYRVILPKSWVFTKMLISSGILVKNGDFCRFQNSRYQRISDSLYQENRSDFWDNMDSGLEVEEYGLMFRYLMFIITYTLTELHKKNFLFRHWIIRSFFTNTHWFHFNRDPEYPTPGDPIWRFTDNDRMIQWQNKKIFQVELWDVQRFTNCRITKH